MNSSIRIPTSYLNIVQKLMVNKSVYQHVFHSLSDALLKIELKRIFTEKEIFIKDFKKINGFLVSTFNKEYGKDVKTEIDNLRLQFDHLITSHDERGILSLILEREQQLSDLYYHVILKSKDDEFIYMILKNQLDETTQSINELKDLLKTFVEEKP